MKFISRVIACVFLFSTIIIASPPYDISMEKIKNYNSWGAAWDTVVVVKNNIITIAAVPKLGGRVMQYDLGSHPSIYINPDMINKTIPDGATLVGGFRQLPSPQSDFTWPPPPTLDFGAYKCAIKSNSADSCVVYLESDIENSGGSDYAKHKGLQYKRTLTMYKASSRVKVEMVMLNNSSTTLNHGIWDITQSECSNNGSEDVQNMWIYFPLNPNSTMGGGKKYVQYWDQGKDTTQWNKNIVPGIMGVQFKKKVAKIGADCKAGWICFVDRRDGYAFVKTFTFQEGKNYPDSGASVQVYTYGNYAVTEVEVLGPLTTLAPNDSVRLVENWYATRAKGPVDSVTNTGLPIKALSASQWKDSVKIEFSYGVFYAGKVRAVFKNSTGTDIAVADSYAVSPRDSFSLKDTLKAPANASKLVLALYSSSGTLIGNLDTAVIIPVGVSGRPDAWDLFGSKPMSVVRKGNVLLIEAPYRGDYCIELTSLDGRKLLSLEGQKPMTYSIPFSKLPAGVICVRLHHAGASEARRVFVR